MKRTRTLYLFRVLGFLSLLNGAYWLLYWELIVWQKDLAAAFTANLFSTFTFFMGSLLMFRPGLIVNRLPERFVKPLECFRSNRTAKPPGFQVPADWVESKMKRDGVNLEDQSLVLEELKGRGPIRISFKTTDRKIRVPGLRLFKRTLAALFVVFYFLISQISISGGGMNIFIGVIFLATSFLMVDYLWKTRRVAVWKRQRDEALARIMKGQVVQHEKS